MGTALERGEEKLDAMGGGGGGGWCSKTLRGGEGPKVSYNQVCSLEPLIINSNYNLQTSIMNISVLFL